MAAGWHFPVKVCVRAPLELQYVAYVRSKIKLSGQSLLSVSHYHKPRQDSSIPLTGFLSVPAVTKAGHTFLREIIKKQGKKDRKRVLIFVPLVLISSFKYLLYITPLQTKSVDLRLETWP